MSAVSDHQMNISTVRLYDLAQDVSHIILIVQLRLRKIRGFVFEFVERPASFYPKTLHQKLEKQPIVICLVNLVKIALYLGNLWLDSILV